MADPRPIHCREVPGGIAWSVDTLCEMARDGASGEVTIELDAGRAVGVQRQLRLRFPGDTDGAIERIRDLVARGFRGKVGVECGVGRGTCVVVEDGERR